MKTLVVSFVVCVGIAQRCEAGELHNPSVADKDQSRQPIVTAELTDEVPATGDIKPTYSAESPRHSSGTVTEAELEQLLSLPQSTLSPRPAPAGAMPNLCPSDYVPPKPWAEFEFNGRKVYLFPGPTQVTSKTDRSVKKEKRRIVPLALPSESLP